jgi:hypothetical protein
MKQLSITGMHPVTWKSGTVRMNDMGSSCPSPTGATGASSAPPCLRAFSTSERVA